ncbi:MAG: HAMP domain-containing sensor histidine kinase [Eubacteriales bacterium]|nr:HAMP domain-containing sensor histidine kinase [Eubacteriales bacterium]
MTKSFRTRFVINLIVAALIVCVLISLLILNYSRLILLFTGVDPGSNTVSSEAAIVIMILAVVLFAFIFWILERRSINYIKELSKGIERIADGDLNTKIEIRGDDEFSQMAESINHMQEDLKELLRLEREAEQQKTDLITNIAHDLRTPLTSIIGYLELLSGKGYSILKDDQRKKYIAIAYTKSKRLEKLIGDLFDFTKLTYGKITMKVGYVDVVKLLEQLLEESYPAFKDKGLKYEFHSNVNSCEITADGGLLARLFDNLIGNAIKYGADGKKVIVKVNEDAKAGTVEIQVINFGFVIEDKDLPYIFDKFYRADKARNTETGGTGLGLAIAKNITQMHGGTITAESGLKGTVFTVRLKKSFEKENENLRRA